ncbi:MAG: transglutaminase domain-containing protein [Vicinamibacteria bacterium]
MPTPTRPRRLRSFHFAWSTLIASALFFPPQAAATKWKDPTDAEKKMVEDPEKGLVGAVYLEKTQLSENRTFRVYVRAKILSKAGFDIGTVERLSPNAEDIAGRTVSPSGNVTEFSRKDVRTMTTVKAAGVSFERKGFTLPALEPGCFIEYTYLEPGSLGSGGSYYVEILFQDKYPILLQELRTPNPFDFSGTSREQNGVRIRFHEERAQYVYETSDVPALREEPYGRPKNERSAEIIFARAPSPGTRRGGRVFSPGLSLDNPEQFWKDATKKLLVPAAKELLVRPGRVADRLKTIEGSREADPIARLRAIYRYVQKNVKNRWALRAGEVEPKGGWKRNQDAGDTLSHGEGDPTDLAMVFASLTRADGWNFKIIFAPDRETRYFHREILSVHQFEAWLIAISDPSNPSRVVYSSFEHPLLPFGVVPWNHLAVSCYAVSLDDESGTVVQIPEAPAQQNARQRIWKIDLTEEGDVRAERESRWAGLPAFELRSELYRKGKEAWEKEVREDYQKLDPPGQVESVSFENSEEPEQNLSSKLRFVRKGMASPLPGGRMELAPLSLMGETNPFTQEKRNDPIIFAYPYLDEDTLTVEVPEGYAVDALPSRVERANNIGRYVASAERGTGDTVVVSRTFELARFFGGPELYPNYRALFEAMAQGDTGFSLVFKKTAAAKKGN